MAHTSALYLTSFGLAHQRPLLEIWLITPLPKSQMCSAMLKDDQACLVKALCGLPGIGESEPVFTILHDLTSFLP